MSCWLLIDADLSATHLLAWSPCGAFLFAAAAGSGSFRLWATSSWTSLSFHTPVEHLATASGYKGSRAALNEVSAACWHRHSRMLLLGFRGLDTLVGVYLTDSAPALDCQLLPVSLPGVSGMACTPATYAISLMQACSHLLSELGLL